MKHPDITRYYSFHGFHIEIVGNHTGIMEALHARLCSFAIPRQPDHKDFCFRFNCITPKEPHSIKSPGAQSRPVVEFAFGEVRYADEEDELFVDFGEDMKAFCRITEGNAWISIQVSKAEVLWLGAHALFTILLVEVLKRRNYFALHAAALHRNGKGLLFPGTSGAGKSTLTVALIRAGFDFLGDDTIFLAPKADRLQMLAFPDELDVTDDTVRLFPELNYLLEHPRKPGSRKWQILAEKVYGAKLIRECQPTVLIFPRVAHRHANVLRVMHRDEALLELIPNILLTEPKSSQSHFDIFAKLVKTCECYRLETGYDLDSLPLLVRDLVE